MALCASRDRMRRVAARSIGIALAATTVPAFGATLTVTNLNDSGPGSLRQAVADANANPGSDMIVFQPGLSGTIVLTSGVLAVNADIVINGPGAERLAVSGNNASRIFDIAHSVQATLRGLSIANGRAPLLLSANGGCIVSDGHLVLVQCRIGPCVAAGEISAKGGGIFSGGGALELDRCLVRGCAATAITLASGGGVASLHTPVVSIRRSTISNNMAQANSFVEGGGLSVINAMLSLENSTVYGNGGSAASPTAGGLYLEGGLPQIRHCTIAGNLAGPGLFYGDTAAGTALPLYLHDTILSANAGGDIALAGTQLISLGNNLVSAGGGGLVHGVNGDLVGTGGAPIDPMLLPLDDYGGSTPTLALAPDSPAIDAGGNFLAPATDQRGFLRVADGDCSGLARADIGAFEYGGDAGLHFDGLNDAVSIPYHPDLNLSAGFTLEAWVRPRVNNNPFLTSRIISNRAPAFLGIEFGFGFGLADRALLFTTFGTQDYVATSALVNWDELTHVAVVFDSAFDARFFINGVFIQSVSGSQAVRINPFPSPLFLGNNPTVDGQNWSGTIQEVRVWNVERNPVEIARDFDRVLSGDEPGLLAYWRLDDGAGLHALDSSPGGYHGTLLNNPYWLAPACTLPPCVDGDANDDGLVTLTDLRILVEAMGKTPATLREGDFDNDGDVDLRDAAILMQNFARECI